MHEESTNEYEAEFVRLWEDAVKTVYLKEPTPGVAESLAKTAKDHTRMTPLRYVVFVANPSNLTNSIGRGQKAREKRWKKWLSALSG